MRSIIGRVSGAVLFAAAVTATPVPASAQNTDECASLVIAQCSIRYAKLGYATPGDCVTALYATDCGGVTTPGGPPADPGDPGTPPPTYCNGRLDCPT